MSASIDMRQQVADQCKAVAHLCGAMASVYSDYASTIEAGAMESLLPMVGKRTAEKMEVLGNMIDGMDASDESDLWLDPVYDRAHEMFPVPADPSHDALAALESILAELGPLGDLHAYRNAPYFVAAQAAIAKARL